MIELKKVSKAYSFFPVVKDVSFTAERGEVVGYLGPNGAGKSTTIKMLAGLIEPTKGEILFDGRNTRDDLYSFKRRLGYVPEQSEIYPHLSGWEYLQFVGRLRQIPEAALERKIREFLKLFGLDDDMHAPISSYSKGMRQKVLLSAALIHDPDILLLDEPLSGLDVTTAMIVRDLVLALAAEKKILIYSSHVLEVTEKICSRVVILHQGRVVADDSVANLRSLMKLPSLEKIFMELITLEDTGATARAFVEAMKR